MNLNEIRLNKLTIICGDSDLIAVTNQLESKLAKDKKRVTFLNYPETGLHPNKQIRLVRTMIKNINEGFTIIICTHSSTIIRELNNSVMLFNGRNKGQFETIRNKYNYELDELLAPNLINAYTIENNQIFKMEICEEGIIAITLDKVIEYLNISSDDIYWNLIKDEEETA